MDVRLYTLVAADRTRNVRRLYIFRLSPRNTRERGAEIDGDDDTHC